MPFLRVGEFRLEPVIQDVPGKMPVAGWGVTYKGYPLYHRPHRWMVVAMFEAARNYFAWGMHKQ